jgi:RNA polymerase subunit RPABC4/transcription elongation factor Spt4
MGALVNGTFLEVVERGCPSCGGKKLAIETYVEGLFPLLDGESDGTVTWAYKGETFVDGVFRIRCAGCKHTVYEDDACPRCHAEGGLARAREVENRRPPPATCPSCGDDTLVARAFVPADVIYQGKRPDKARAGEGLADPGFHVVRLDCTTCGPVEPAGTDCPLCAAEGPVRPQPT